MLFRKPAAMTRSPAKLLLIVAAVLPAIAAAQVRKKTAPGERVLHFPPDRSLGRLQAYRGSVADPYDHPATYENAPHPWEFLAEARGDVAVPADKLVRLDVGMKNLKDIPHLKRLKPDDLDRLVIGSKVTDRGLSHLRSMKKLDLLCVFGDFTDEGLRHLEQLRSLEHLKIRSDRPLSRAAQTRLQQALPHLYSFEVSKEPARKKGRGGQRQ